MIPRLVLRQLYGIEHMVWHRQQTPNSADRDRYRSALITLKYATPDWVPPRISGIDDFALEIAVIACDRAAGGRRGGL